MKPQDVIKHYKTQKAAADALGIGQSAVANWVMRDKIPDLSQLRIEVATGGKLKADKAILKIKPARKVSRA